MRGREAYDALMARSVDPRTPTVRSSDAKSRCDFHYYLTRRLGLQPRYSYREALSQGSWFHRAAELWDHPLRTMLYEKSVREACAAIETRLAPMGESQVANAALQCVEDARYALTLWNIAIDTPIGGTSTLRDRFANPHERDLGREVVVTTKLDEARGTSTTAQFDRVVYSELTNRVWLWDYKSTSQPPHIRAMQCSLDFQTRLYLRVLREGLESGDLQARWDIPVDARVGGMLHVIVQKPPTKPNADDRDIVSWRPVKRRTDDKAGRWKKGDTTPEPVYAEDGKPVWKNYVARITRWYHGTDEYDGVHHMGPPVNFHRTTPEMLEHLDPDDDEFRAIYRRLVDLATRTPYPCNFTRNPEALMANRSTPSIYAPFYLLPVDQWPVDDFVREWRDEKVVENDDVE